MKANIIKNELYIGRLHRVVSSYLLRGAIKGRVSRGSDGFIYITEGACTYSFRDGTSFTAKQDQLLYLAKDDLYDMEITSERYSFVLCDFDFICENSRRSAVYSLSDPLRVKLQFEQLLSLFEKKRPAWISDCISLLYKIYSCLIQLKANYAAPTSRQIAYEAQSICMEHLASQELGVTFVAERLKISETHLRRIFNKVFGVSPIKYIQYARVSRASDLMTVSGLSMCDIAEQCGFSDYPYFCRSFKNITGKTPGEYRDALMQS